MFRTAAGPDTPYINKVLKAKDKHLHTPEGERFREYIANHLDLTHEELAPYLAHRFKQGDVRVGRLKEDSEQPTLEWFGNHEPITTWRPRIEEYIRRNPESRAMSDMEDRMFTPLLPGTLANWNQWYQAKQHPLRKGVNILDKNMTPYKLHQTAFEFRKQLQREEEFERYKDSGQVIHTFPPAPSAGVDWDKAYQDVNNKAGPMRTEEEAAKIDHMDELQEMEKLERDGQLEEPSHIELDPMYQRLMQEHGLPARKSGWTIRSLPYDEDLEAEGRMMGHCIGSHEQPYIGANRTGRITPFSLRDPKGHPHVTWHYNSDGSLAEVFGPNDDPIKPHYQKWIQEVQPEMDPERAQGNQENGEVGQVTLPAAEDLAAYNAYWHPEHRYEAASEYNEDDEGDVGENTEIDAEEPDWQSLAREYLDAKPHDPDAHYNDETNRNRLEQFQRFHERQMDEFHEALGMNAKAPGRSYPEGYATGHPQEFQDALAQEMWDNHPNFPRMHPDEEPVDPNWIKQLHRWNTWSQSDENGEAYNMQPFDLGKGHEDPEPDWTQIEDPHLREQREIQWRQQQADKMGQGQMFVHNAPDFNWRTSPINTFSFVKTADKFHDFLMNPQSRPDLQTPEAQQWLQYLEPYHNQRTDALMPWLTREWKKGHVALPQYQPAYGETAPQPENLRYDPFGTGRMNYSISPTKLNSWADFYHSRHPIRRGLGDIMQHSIYNVGHGHDQWMEAVEEEERQKAAEEARRGGEIVHQWPNGESIRRLTNADECTAEGDAMGHCVGSYGNDVENGRTLIYSLRDPKGDPHATLEINPHKYEYPKNFDLEQGFNAFGLLPEEVKNQIRQHAQGGLHEDTPVHGTPHSVGQWLNQVQNNWREKNKKGMPEGGEVVQIQGKSNAEPIPQYKDRLRNWFESMKQRPTMGSEDYEETLTDPRDIRERHYNPQPQFNEYGLLQENPADVSYEYMLKAMVEGNGWRASGNYAQEIYDLAKHRGDLSDLRHELKSYKPEAEQEFQNYLESGGWESVSERAGPNPEDMEWHDFSPRELREHGWEKTWSEMDEDERSSAMSDWEGRESEAYQELAEEFPKLQAVKDLERLLARPDHVGGFMVRADKLHDFLMNPQSRPDLQTPEGQQFLESLDMRQQQVGQKMDQLTPWLTREWKKGRLGYEPPDLGRWNQPPQGRLFYKGIQAPGNVIHSINLDNDRLGHWADFMQSNHPLKREMGDIMQHEIHPFHQRVQNWSDQMKAEADQKALQGGETVHQWPDGWHIKRLHTPEELKAEGSSMGHCVGGYSHPVETGETSIYSLRDPKGVPHVTTEIRPRYVSDENGKKVKKDFLQGPFDSHEVTPEDGEVIQIQGKGNDDPKDEYKARIKDWFDTFRRKPEMTGDYELNDPRDIQDLPPHYHQPDGKVNEYGLEQNIPSPQWRTLIEEMDNGYGSEYAKDVVDLAHHREELGELNDDVMNQKAEWERHIADKVNSEGYWYMREHMGLEEPKNPEEHSYDWDELPEDRKESMMNDYEEEKDHYDDELSYLPERLEQEHEGLQAMNEMEGDIYRIKRGELARQQKAEEEHAATS